MVTRTQAVAGQLVVTLVVLAMAMSGCSADVAPPAPPLSESAVPPDISELSRVPWEGGPGYYQKFPQAVAAGWSDPNFFPVGVWYESVLTQSDVDKDRAVGLNSYFELTPNSDVDLLRRNRMTAVSSTQIPGAGDETVGWLLTDEPDMWAGPGDAPWTGEYPGYGEICEPASAKCGYTVLRELQGRFPQDGRMRYANYGKGVFLWYTDAEVAAFVNDFTQVVSTDIYWYTDPNICGEAERFLSLSPALCRLAANYGAVIDRQRELDSLDGKRQPIFGFVENGLPFTKGGGRAITGDQLKGAVMNSLIHEARGILYFNHNFEGDCQTQHVFREPCGDLVRPAATQVNKQIAELAPVLNTQSYEYVLNPQLDSMLKSHDGFHYVFAMVGRGNPAPGTYEMTLPNGIDATHAEVLFENRTVPISEGRISDGFEAESSYHIYKIAS